MEMHITSTPMPATLTVGNIINNTNTSDPTDFRNLYLQGNSNGTVTGLIKNGTGTTNTFNVVKEGSSTWTLMGSNSYSGSTIIRQGTLALGPSGYFSGTGIQVMSGATFDVSNYTDSPYGYCIGATQTLSGSGTVKGNLSDNPGSVISPGDGTGAGTLTFTDSSSTILLTGGDFINYNISDPAADLLDVKGNLSFTGGGGMTTIRVLPNKVVNNAQYTVASTPPAI